MTVALLSYGVRQPGLLRALAATGRYEMFLAVPSEVVPSLAMLGFPYRLMADSYTPEVEQAARARYLEMLPRWQQALQEPAFQAQFEFQGRSLWPRLKAPLVIAMHDGFQEAIRHREMLVAFVARQRLGLILLPHDVTLLTKTIAQAARELGVATLHLEHGSPALRNVHDRIHTDKIAVYGNYCRDWYVAQGNDPARVVVTGNPAWDGYARLAGQLDRAALARFFGADPARPLVLFASSWTHRLTAFSDRRGVEDSYRCVVRAVASLQASHGVQLMVKLHPGEPHEPETYARVAAEEGVALVHVARDPLEEQVLASDAVICLESNLAIEAMLLQRPVITLTLEEFPLSRAYRLFDDRDAVLRVERREDLAPAILAACTDGPTQARLAAARAYSLPRFNGPNDDGATARVIQLIADLITTPAALRGEAPAPVEPCSIVIVTRNGGDYLRICIELLEQHTPESHELIVVDNGSTDGSLQWLRTLAGVQVIANAGDASFAAACRQGLAAARGAHVVLLDDHVIVAPGWLGRLAAAARRDPQVGLVGPRTNAAAGEQEIGGVPYGDDLPQMQAYAAWRASALAGQGFHAARAGAFCLLLTRAAIEQAAAPDPGAAGGDFAAELCRRAGEAGFRIWIADDVFVHRFGVG